MEFLPFALPDIGDEEIDEVVSALKSGWVTTGPKAKQFEEDFSQFLGGGLYSIAVNSATAGLHLALEACGIGPGDEVITSPYTFTATAEVVRYLGAHPVFVDIEPNTFSIDADKIEAAITPRTKAIIPIHVGGLACNMGAIIALAQKYKLKVIEDAAHALPTTWNRKLVGTLESDATVFSFYATKTITTGEGGMIVTREANLAERCKVMRLHGINRDAFDRYTSTTPSWYYEIVAPGFKYNLTDVAASLGIQQLKKAWKFYERRKAIAAQYDEGLKDLSLILPPHSAEGEMQSWHLYVIRLTENAKVQRNDFIQRMADEGIGCSVHYIPLHLHPYWKETYGLKPEDFPNALHAYQGAVSLPIFTKMTDTDVTRVIQAVRSVLA